MSFINKNEVILNNNFLSMVVAIFNSHQTHGNRSVFKRASCALTKRNDINARSTLNAVYAHYA